MSHIAILIVSLLWVGCGSKFEDLFFKTDLRHKGGDPYGDSDNDGILNGIERANGLDPKVDDASDDFDGDGLANRWEIDLGLDPHNPKTADDKADCDSDFDKDGAGNCWEIAHGYNPKEPSDGLADDDKDGFTNAEESAVALDPKDAASHPGKTPLFTIADADLKVTSRTNSTFVNGTYSFCNEGDFILFTSNGAKPASDDGGFVPCSTAENALAGVVDSEAEGPHTMYVWRRTAAAGVIDTPASAVVVMDKTSPTGGDLVFASVTSGTANLTHTPPTDADFTTVELRRFTAYECSSTPASEGTVVTITKDQTAIADAGLALGVPYCYKVQWTDDLGNVAEKTVTLPVDASGASAGSPTLTVFDNDQSVSGRTNSTTVRGTYSFCASGDALLFTASSTKPEANDAGFVSCSTEAMALSGTLGSAVEGAQTMYVWRRDGASVVAEPASSATVTLDTQGPSGTLTVSNVSGAAVDLAHTLPTDADYTIVTLRRHAAYACVATAATEGTAVTMTKDQTALTDGSLPLGVPYCYKIFWNDDLGNVSSQSVAVPDNGLGTRAGSPSLVISDNDLAVDGRTNSTSVRGTYSFCTTGDSLLFTSSSTKPAATDAGFVACTTASRALTGTLGSAVEGSQTMYVWRRDASNVVGNTASTATVTLDTTAPAVGSLVVSGLQANAVVLGHTPPVDADYTSVVVRRHTSSPCLATTSSAGTNVPLAKAATSVTDGSLSLSTVYCYKAFWSDDLGNTRDATSTAVYDGVGPGPGSLSVQSLSSQAITLSHTKPVDADYAALTLRRIDNTSTCAASTATDGTGVTMAIAATSLTDSSLLLAKAYCYKIFWYDGFGNFTQGSTAPGYDGDGPTGGTLSGNSVTASSVTLNHAKPTEVGIGAPTSVVLRRYNGTGCSGSAESGGTGVTINLNDATVTDTGLTSGATYCYQVFWADAFGNKKIVAVDSQTTTAPTCSLATSRDVWYVGGTASYTYNCNGNITSVTDATSSWPAFLTTAAVIDNSGSPKTATLSDVTSGAIAATTFTVRFNGLTQGSANVSTPIEVTNSVSYTTPSTSTLSDASAASLAPTATLDSDYDGAPTLKTLMGDAVSPSTTSNGTVAATETDIPSLIYSDSSACAGAASPEICAISSSFSSPTLTGSFKVFWNYDIFDQGQYKVVTKGLMQADGAKFYDSGTATSRTTRLTTSNVTGEAEVVSNTSGVGQSSFADPARWHLFIPVLALNTSLSSATDYYHGFAYPALLTQERRFGGFARVNRATSTTAFASKTWFDQSSDSQLSPDGQNTESLAIAAAATDEWIVLGGNVTAASGRDLMLSAIDQGAGTPVSSDFNVSDLANISSPSSHDTSKIFQVAIGPSFNDGGTTRHGVAFFGSWEQGNRQSVYVSKVRSAPSTKSVANYFDATSYYENDGDQSDNNVLTDRVPSYPITADLSADVSMVRLVNAVEGGTNYFYVGWRNESTAAVTVARVPASVAPSTVLTSATITGMDSFDPSEERGRPSYAIAHGQDKDGTVDILGLFYVTDVNSTIKCRFQAFKVDSGTLKKWGQAFDLSGATDCRFVSLFYNTFNKMFMAVYARADSNDGDTIYHEFQFDNSGASETTGGSITASSTSIVTARTGIPCQLSANYAPTLGRIGIVSVEGSCSASSEDMVFDTYKVAQ